MMEGRKCIVYLPNYAKLDLNVNVKQLGKELWRTVVHKLRLREEDYFGLKYKATGDHYSWLQLDKKVLDHDMEMKATIYPLEFIFSVKFFEDSVTVHKHPSTVELVFLQAQNLMYNGELYVPADLSLELSALSLQAFYGDFISEETAVVNLERLTCLPRSVIRELASLEYCEEQVISWYKNLCGFSRGQAVLLYMSKVEKLPNYGIHFFKVKDKEKVDWWLGICNKGIYQYRIDNKVTPHQVFQWRNLENLYFREKKFSVEVCSGHKRALSTGSTNVVSVKEKKPGNNQSPPKTHTWYGYPALIKSIWTMAIVQHQFYWEKKQSSKSKSNTNKTSASSLRNALDKNPSSRVIPPTAETIMQRKANRKSADSTPNVKRVAPKPPESPEVKAIEEKMIGNLKKRKLALEDRLYDKVQELKEICKEEYNLTERLPIEYLRYMLPDEERPVLKKKIGAEYRVQLRQHPNRVYKHDPATASELQRLESECELLNQIAKAAYKLAYETSSRGRLKKKRLQSYQKALKKLQEMENRVNELRERHGQEAAFRQSTLIMPSDLAIMNAMKECSLDDKSDRCSLSSGNMIEDETSVSSGAEVHSTHSTPALSQRPSASADVDVEEVVPIQRSRTPPPTKSTKLAWLESPMTKTKKRDDLSPNGSYPVLPSPVSYHSTTSHSSGTETPPHGRNREKGRKWAATRHQDGWKMSSLDSLDSLGSRKSNSTTHGSPQKHHTSNGDVMNANARRIAKAAKSAQANKVSLREKQVHMEPSRRMGTVNPVLDIVQDTARDDGKDSRTSLTDSGVGTDSRVPSTNEDEISRRMKSRNIWRDKSDSSLSELSTQSNPTIMPTNIPKFFPSIMSRTHRNPNAPASQGLKRENEQPHVRKRSSSFTESASGTLTKQTFVRDPHRTLTRTKTPDENENPPAGMTDSSFPNGEIPSQREPADKLSQPVLTTSQSANQFPPPIFDTNLNICKQYFSRSQGQLVQNNGNNVAVAQPSISDEAASGTPYISVVDKQLDALNPANVQRPTYSVSVNNSNNNKLNFGQIYKLSQAPTTQNYARLQFDPNERRGTPEQPTSSHNVPKSNSLDSVLDRVHPVEHDTSRDTSRNYYAERRQYVQHHKDPSQYPTLYSPSKSPQQRSAASPPSSSQQGMTTSDRDRYNNEAFQEIRGMAWVPSLDEYGSRASVAESLPAKSKREDIRELLQQHFSQNRMARRTPSSSSTTVLRTKQERKLQAQIRADMLKEKESQKNPESSTKAESTSTTWEDYKRNMTLKKNQNQAAQKYPSKSDHAAVNIFAHKAPPPLPQQAQKNYSNSHDTASGYQMRTIHKGYVNPNGYPAADERRNAQSSQVPVQQKQYPAKNVQSLQHGQHGYYYQSQQRSLSETWKQQNIMPVSIPQQHHHPVPVSQQHHPQMYRVGHQGMDHRTAHERPRRTASADDLLWPTPDGRDPTTGRNMRSQQGTLV